MTSSLPIFSSMNSLLMFVVLILWLPWHFFLFSTFCAFLLPLFPHVLLQTKALFQALSPYKSFLPFHRLSAHNQPPFLPYSLFLFLSHFSFLAIMLFSWTCLHCPDIRGSCSGVLLSQGPTVTHTHVFIYMYTQTDIMYINMYIIIT